MAPAPANATLPEEPASPGSIWPGLMSISVVIALYIATEENSTVLETASMLAIRFTGYFLDSIYYAFDFLTFVVVPQNWVFFLGLLVTWLLFPDVIEDIVFLIYLGYLRYRDLLFK